MGTQHVVRSTWNDPHALAQSGSEWSRHVTVSRVDDYDIVVRADAIDDWPAALIATQPDQPTAWVVTDETTWKVHGDRVLSAPGASRLVGGVFALQPGEASKSVDGWRDLLEWLRENRVRRRDVLVAVGGSMVSDVVGFAAATHMRGIPYFNVPTTLVAQVDGAMGGKVAVNTPAAKNLVGAFHHPVGVLADPSLLVTLPRRELAGGLSEAIKTAIVASPDAFDVITDLTPACLDGDPSALASAVRLCASIKMHVLDPDPYEIDLRRVLNFGHTVGHAIETATEYGDVRHGEAVAIGMAIATRLGEHRGLTSAPLRERILSALEKSELPIWGLPGTGRAVIGCLRMIEAIRNGSLRFVVPVEFGTMAILEDVSGEEILPLIEPPIDRLRPRVSERINVSDEAVDSAPAR